METPIILLDVDGVLNPCPFDKHPRGLEWKFEPTFRSCADSGGFPLNLSKEMGQALLDLKCEIRWLTTWIRDADLANKNIGSALGWERQRVCAITLRGLSDYYWKPRYVKELLKDPGPRVVWIDDDADGYAQHFDEGELDPHNRLLIICPECDIGITHDHIDTIKLFLSE